MSVTQFRRIKNRDDSAGYLRVPAFTLKDVATMARVQSEALVALVEHAIAYGGLPAQSRQTTQASCARMQTLIEALESSAVRCADPREGE